MKIEELKIDHDLTAQVMRRYSAAKFLIESTFGISLTPTEAASIRRHLEAIIINNNSLAGSSPVSRSTNMVCDMADLIGRFLADYGLSGNFDIDDDFITYFQIKRAQEID